MKIRFLIAIMLGIVATFSTFAFAQKKISLSGTQPAKVQGHSQSAFGQSPPTRTGYPIPPIAQGIPLNHQQSNFFASANESLQPKVDKKLREYKKAKSSSDKSKLESELKELLEAQFEERLKRPVAAIEHSRKRLDQLTEQHKSREKNSRDIVSLRLKVIINEALGLGWQGGQTRTVTGYPLPARTVRWGREPSVATTYTVPGPTISGTQPRLPIIPAQAPGIATSNAAPKIAQGFPLPTARTPKSLTPEQQKSSKSLLADYKEAEDESEKEDILDELSALLEKEFAAHQEQIQKQIDGIENQISDLEENIEMRKDAKDKIVKLKLQTLINQANGLGF